MKSKTFHKVCYLQLLGSLLCLLKLPTVCSVEIGEPVVPPLRDNSVSSSNSLFKTASIQSRPLEDSKEKLLATVIKHSELDLSPPEPKETAPVRRGVLRVRITEFLNPSNKDADGDCCMDFKDEPTCKGHCRLFFRVCATHSARNILLSKPASPQSRKASNGFLPTVPPSSTPSLVRESRSPLSMPSLKEIRHKMMLSRRASNGFSNSHSRPYSYKEHLKKARKSSGRSIGRNRGRTSGQFNPNIPCTLGLIVTEVIANSSLRANVEGALDITFPFVTEWPVSFRLIVEAWHDVTGNLFNNSKSIGAKDRAGTLVSRHAARLSVAAGQAWQTQRRVMNYASSIIYGVRVICTPPYSGARCTNKQGNALTQESSNVSVRGDCGATKRSHGVCGPEGKLRCREGWTGELCDGPVCKEGCSQQNGYCDQPEECLCKPGWKGLTCEDCVQAPECRHGSCNGTVSSCDCHSGWKGRNCDKAICRKGCHPTRGYCNSPGECKCRYGWSGPNCSDCSITPGCKNGFCHKPLECRCNPGWSGHLCQNPVCSKGCDPVHGSCLQPGECRCEVGWVGPNCSTCHPYPGCANGYCTKPWECKCKQGWTGMICNEKVNETSSYCDQNPNICLNGGTCVNDIKNSRNFSCLCAPKFKGDRCNYIVEKRAIPSIFKSPTTTTEMTTTTSKPPTTTPYRLPVTRRIITIKRNTPAPSTTTTTTIKPLFAVFKPNFSAHRRLKNLTPSPSRSSLSRLSVQADETDPVIVNYDESPRGQHSRIHSVTASPKKLKIHREFDSKEHKKMRELDSKNARKLFLQKQAVITFKQPRILPPIRVKSRPLKLPFTVIDRKHLSLPVFLPRVIDARRNGSRHFNSAEDDITIIAENPDEKQSVLANSSLIESEEQVNAIQNNNHSKSLEKSISVSQTQSYSSTTAIKSSSEATTSSPQSSTTSTTEQTQFVQEPTDEVTTTEIPTTISYAEEEDDFFSPSEEFYQPFDDEIYATEILESEIPVDVNEKKTRLNDNTPFKRRKISDFARPKPVLLVDYRNNDNQKPDNNQIEDSINFINEKRRYLQPESMSLGSESSKESSGSGPSRPMFLVAVRPIPRQIDGSFNPPYSSSTSSVSHANYNSEPFIEEVGGRRKFVLQGRSVSGRSPLQLSSPSFSVSQPLNMRHFAPQTRLSRRIGHQASSPVPLISSFGKPLSSHNSDTAKRKGMHFYQENSAGPVHIGVDRHTPHEALLNAFIEIKKANT